MKPAEFLSITNLLDQRMREAASRAAWDAQHAEARRLQQERALEEKNQRWRESHARWQRIEQNFGWAIVIGFPLYIAFRFGMLWAGG
jgi:hypothetical protein